MKPQTSEEYFEDPQHDWIIAGPLEANRFCILAKALGIEFTYEKEEYFYSFNLIGNVSQMRKFKEQWQDFKFENKPIDYFAYSKAHEIVDSQTEENLPTYLAKSKNWKRVSFCDLHIYSPRQKNYELNQIRTPDW